MKIHISLIPILIFTLIVRETYSQKYELKVSSKQREIKSYQKFNVLTTKNLVTVYVRSRNLLTVESLNTETMDKKSVDHSDIDNDYEVENVVSIANNIYVFLSIWDKKSNLEQLFVRKLNPKDGTFIGEKKLVFKLNGRIKPLPSVSFYNSKKFIFKKSFNENFLLIQSTKFPEIRDDNKSHQVLLSYVFNEEMDLEWKKQTTLPYTENIIDIYDYSVSSNGTLNFISRVYDKNRQGHIIQQESHLELFQLNGEMVKPEILKFQFKKKTFESVTILHPSVRSIVISGFYRNINDHILNHYGDVRGSFAFKIVNNNHVVEKRFYPFETTTYLKNRSEKIVDYYNESFSKGDSTIKSMFNRQFYNTTNNGLLIIGEIFNSHGYSFSAYGFKNFSKEYAGGNIVATKLDSNLNLVWTSVVPKKQHVAWNKSASFGFIELKDFHFVYVDNVENSNIKNEEPERIVLDKEDYNGNRGDLDRFFPDGGHLFCSKLNYQTGQIEKTKILNLEDYDIKEIFISDAHKLDDGAIILEATNSKKEHFWIKIILN